MWGLAAGAVVQGPPNLYVTKVYVDALMIQKAAAAAAAGSQPEGGAAAGGNQRAGGGGAAENGGAAGAEGGAAEAEGGAAGAGGGVVENQLVLYEPEGSTSIAEQFRLFFEREEKKVNKGGSFSLQVRAHTAYTAGKLDNTRLVARLVTRDRGGGTFERMRANVKGWRKAAKDGKYAMVDETLDSCDKLQYQQGAKKRVSGCKNPGPAPAHEGLEEEMEMWVKGMRKKAKRVTRHLVLREVMKNYPVFCGGVDAPDLWKKVLGWYQRFCRRKNLVRLTMTSKGRKLPRGWESVWRKLPRRCQTLRAKV